jgi:hypothetical protein
MIATSDREQEDALELPINATLGGHQPQHCGSAN